MKAQHEGQTIVFFDGVCHLCNKFVDFSLRNHPPDEMKFAPLQGTTAAEKVPESLRKELNTIVYWRHGEVLQRSQAVLMILHDLGGLWRVLSLLARLCPSPLRDFFYRKVAVSRYKWFGERDQCRLPSPEEKRHFLS